MATANPFMPVQRDSGSTLVTTLVAASCLFAGIALLMPIVAGGLGRLLP